MRYSQSTLNHAEQDRLLREELPGCWYNYEPSVITLDVQEFDHWLARLDIAMNPPIAQPAPVL
jgi:hypothetical protein